MANGKGNTTLQQALHFMRSSDFRSALAECKNILATVPQHIPARYLAGICLIREGLAAEAVNHLEAACRGMPDMLDAWLNLAIAQRMAGDISAAAATLQHALKVEPQSASVRNNLGIIQSERGDKSDALIHLQQAVELEPDRPEYLCNLANLLRDLERDDEALPHYRHAVDLGLEQSEVFNSLAAILAKHNGTEEAIAYYRRSLSLNPSNAKIQLAVGNLLSVMGRFDEAETHFRLAVELNPNLTQAYRQLVHVHPLSREDQSLANKIEFVLRQSDALTDSANADLHFALGKYHDSRAEYDEAFEHYQSANRLLRQEMTFDRAQVSARIDKVIATFTPELFSQHDASNESEQAVIICGLPRSGTTLTEQILASHPQAFGAGEQPFWGDQEKMLAEKLQAQGGRWPEDILILMDGTLQELAQAYLKMLNGLAAAAPLKISDKMPGNFLHLGLIHLALPNAKIIHCRRNPLDNALSLYSLRFAGLHPYAYDLDDLAFYIGEHNRLLRHWRKIFSREIFLEIQYEDTVAELEQTARTLIDFVGLHWDDRCLAFHNNDRPVRTASQWQVRQPIYDTSVGRWKNYRDYLGPLQQLIQN